MFLCVENLKPTKIIVCRITLMQESPQVTIGLIADQGKSVLDKRVDLQLFFLININLQGNPGPFCRLFISL